MTRLNGRAPVVGKDCEGSANSTDIKPWRGAEQCRPDSQRLLSAAGTDRGRSPMDRLRRGKTRAELVPAHAHLVGLADRGMAGLAQMLVEGGLSVTAADADAGTAVNRLRR